MKVFCLNLSHLLVTNKTKHLYSLRVRFRNVIWECEYLFSHDIKVPQFPWGSIYAHIHSVVSQQAQGSISPYSRLWLNVEQPGFIFSQPLRGKQRGLNDVMISMWLTTEGDVEGRQQSVLSLWSHGSRETQLGHHVTEGWLRSSN